MWSKTIHLVQLLLRVSTLVEELKVPENILKETKIKTFIKDGIEAHIYNVFNLFHICGLSHLHIDKLEFTNSKGAHQILLRTLFLSVGVKSPFWDTNWILAFFVDWGTALPALHGKYFQLRRLWNEIIQTSGYITYNMIWRNHNFQKIEISMPPDPIFF